MTGATEVLKQPKQVLARFPLVRNLKEHFIRVAAVADIICENWTGPTLDRDTIVAACLLHDVGNIMKIDFDSQWQQELMKRDKELIPEYKETQSRARAHFGNDTDAVRAGLLKQAGIEPELREFIDRARGLQMPRMLREYDYAGMIYLYCDNRVMPNGVCLLRERIADAKQRYPGYYETAERSAIDYEQKLWEIERALQTHCAIPLDSITDNTIAKHPLWKALH